MRVETNLGSVADGFRRRGDDVAPAVRRGLRTIGIQLERGITRNLTGGGGPGSYPVPRRTGFLARSTSPPVLTRNSVSVSNDATYALAVHEGFRAFGNPSAPYYGPRRFAADAVDKVDGVQILLAELERTP